MSDAKSTNTGHYPLIDAQKMLMAIAVIVIHTNPLAVFMLGRAIKLPDSSLFFHLRRLSRLTYYIHAVFVGLLVVYFRKIGIPIPYAEFFFAVLVLSLLSSEIIIRLSDKKSLAFLKYLY